ncbi:MAG: hypothetical protein V3S64_05585, partial [bacterium]
METVFKKFFQTDNARPQKQDRKIRKAINFPALCFSNTLFSNAPIFQHFIFQRSDFPTLYFPTLRFSNAPSQAIFLLSPR